MSIAGAVYYTLPLFITLFSAVFVGEKVGMKGWVAVAIGFIGVLWILKPQAGDFNVYALLPLASAIFYACAMILTRTKIRDESGLVLVLSLNVAFLIVGAVGTLAVAFWAPTKAQVVSNPFLLGEWSVLGLQETITIVVLATLVTTSSLLATIAYQNGPVVDCVFVRLFLSAVRRDVGHCVLWRCSGCRDIIWYRSDCLCRHHCCAKEESDMNRKRFWSDLSLRNNYGLCSAGAASARSVRLPG